MIKRNLLPILPHFPPERDSICQKRCIFAFHSPVFSVIYVNTMMQYPYFLVLTACFGFLSPLSGQTKVTASASVDRMMGKMISRGKSVEQIKAWRIQIITTDNRREMETTRAKFKSLYPDVTMDWKHVAPYYQVRVGFFETKNKLMPFLLEVKENFPSATPVYDNVSKRDLVSD
jgi:hypothetical protein